MLYKLRVRVVDLAAGRAATDMLSEFAGSEPLAVTLFEDRPPTFIVEAYYDAEPALETISCALGELGPRLGAPTLETVPDANWVALSQAALRPVAAGRFLVHGSHDRARLGSKRFAIEIDAGEAFGTGHSATTALCLEAIDLLARRHRFKRVLDLGCGTGILAIGAARAAPGAAVLAVDNDPLATAVARANVHTNRLANRVRVVDAGGFGHRLLRTPGGFDLVLANLLPGPLVHLKFDMRRALRRGGIAVVCGLLDHQSREVCAAYVTVGFRLLRWTAREGWTALTFLRR
jgi:ribosomal protein L11 methyltransferase